MEKILNLRSRIKRDSTSFRTLLLLFRMTMTCAFNKSFLAPCGRGVRRGGKDSQIYSCIVRTLTRNCSFSSPSQIQFRSLPNGETKWIGLIISLFRMTSCHPTLCIHPILNFSLRFHQYIMFMLHFKQ